MKQPFKSFLAFCFCLFISLNLHSQGPNFNYAKQIGNSSYDAGHSIVCDTLGNTYTTGYFSGVCDFDPGTSSYTLASYGLTDCFVTKLDPLGNFIWAKQIGGTLEEKGYSISIDSFGNLYVAGTFVGTTDFNPSTSVYTISCFGGTQEDGFIVKLDGSGNFIWAAQIGGTGPDYIYSIKADAVGNNFVTGKCTGSCDFDPSSNTYTQNVTYSQCFVLKLNSAGIFNWVKSFNSIGGTGSAGQGVNIDQSGNVYTTGYFSGVTDFDFYATNYTITAQGSQTDIFICKYNSSGTFVWAKTFSGPSDEQGTDLEVDPSGNIYSCGYFNDVVDFDPSTGTYTLSSGTSIRNIYISKLNSSGNFIWAKKIGGVNTDDRAYALTLDIMQNVYVAGSFNGTVDFDPGASTNTVTSLASDNDIYVVKLDLSGNFVWAKTMQGTMDDKAFGISLDRMGNIHTTGSFNGTVDFDPNAGTYNLTNPSTIGLQDIFISKLSCESPTLTLTASNTSICVGNTITLNASGASTYTWSNGIPNNSPFSPLFSQTYSATGTGTSGCVSPNSSTIFITVNQLPLVMANANTLDVCRGGTVVVLGSGASTYTWLSSDGSNISNNVPFTPTVTASYSVTGLSAAGCKGMSISFATITIHELPLVLASTNTSLICKGESATLTAQGALNYIWNTSATNSVIVVSPIISTTYSVIGTDENGCNSSSSFTQQVSECVGLKKIPSNIVSELVIFPNPNNGSFKIYSDKEIELDIFNLNGQKIKTILLKQENYYLSNITDLDKGMYIVKWINNEKSYFKKILVLM